MPEQSELQYIGPRFIEPPTLPTFCGNAPTRRFAVGPYQWLVCEHRDEHGAALFFFGPGVARRVRNYPANWQDLPDEALYAVSWTY